MTLFCLSGSEKKIYISEPLLKGYLASPLFEKRSPGRLGSNRVAKKKATTI